MAQLGVGLPLYKEQMKYFGTVKVVKGKAGKKTPLKISTEHKNEQLSFLTEQ